MPVYSTGDDAAEHIPCLMEGGKIKSWCIDDNQPNYALDTGAVNAYAIALPVAISGYNTGLTLRFKVVAASNSTTATIAVNGLAAKAIRTAAGGALSGGELVQGSVYTLTYDGTVFRMQPSVTGGTNPMSALGDVTVGGAGGALARMAAQTAAVKEFMTETGTGAAGAAPAWSLIEGTDLAAIAVGTSAGSVNAYTGILAPAITAYAVGLYVFTAGAATNTGAATLTLNSLASKAIVTRDNAALVGGEIVNGSTYVLWYDGTSFRIIGGLGLIRYAAELPRYVTDTGAQNAYAGTLTPAITAYPTGLTLALTIVAATNTTAATLQLNSIATPKAIVNNLGTALAGGELVQNKTYWLVYDGTSFRILGEANPMGAAGDMAYGGTAGKPTLLSANASATKMFLQETSSVPSWGALIDADLPSTTIQHARVQMTAAQVNGMYATPLQIIAAPGANKMIQVHSFNLGLIYGSAAFASGGIPVLQYDTTVNGAGTSVGGGALLAANITAGASANTRRVAGERDTTALTGVVNKSVCLSNQTGAFTTGTGCALDVDVFYSVIATN